MQEKDESRYRILLESIQTPVLAIISDFTVFFCNNAYAQLMKKSADDIEGANLLDLIHGDENTSLVSFIKEVLVTREVKDFEERIGNLYFHINIHLTPWGVIVFYEDISHRKEIEEELRNSELRFRMMIEQFPVGIMIYELNGQVLYGNQAIKDLWDISSADYKKILKSYNILKDEQLAEQGMLPLIKRGFMGEKVSIPTVFYNHNFDLRRSKSSKSNKIWLQNQIYPIRNKEGDPMEILHIQQDITEQKKVEKVLIKERDTAQRYLDIIPVIMIALDLGGKITLINREGCETLGFQEIDLIGKNFFDNFIPKDIREQVKSVFHSITKGVLTPHERYQNVIKTRNGDKRYISWRNTLLTDNDNSIIGTLSSGEDITDQRQILERMKKSETRYRTLVASSPEGIWVSDQNNVTTFVNPAVEQMLGYGLEEIINKPVTDFLVDESLAEFEFVSKSRKEGVTTSSYELTFKRKDGSSIITRVSGTILYNDENEVIGSSAILTDITTQKQAENFLRKARDYLSKEVEERTQDLNEEKIRIETIVEKIPAGIVVIDNESRFYLVNHMFHELYEKIYNVKLPSSLSEVLILKNTFGDTISKIFYSKIEKTITIEPIKGLHLELASSPVIIPEGTHLGILIIVRDVSPFVALDNLRKQFVSTVSHELRTPITGISLSIQNLQKYWDKFSEIEKRSLIETISFSSNVLTQMVEDLLIASRIEADKFNINWQSFTLNKTINEVLIQMDAKQKEKDIKIEVKADPNIHLMGDEKRIGQVLRILIDNAYKYSTRTSEVKIEVVDNYKGIYNEYGNEGVLIKVIDHGRGIPENDIPYIFDRYFRSKDIADIPGTGVGLNIAKAIIEEHYGNLVVKSEFGKGSTFIVLLPRIKEIKEVLDRNERSDTKS